MRLNAFLVSVTVHNDKLVLVAETLIKREKIDRDLFLKLMDENYNPDEDVQTTVETESVETQDTVIEEVTEVIEENVVENQFESDVASEIITEQSDETTD